MKKKLLNQSMVVSLLSWRTLPSIYFITNNLHQIRYRYYFFAYYFADFLKPLYAFFSFSESEGDILGKENTSMKESVLKWLMTLWQY